MIYRQKPPYSLWDNTHPAECPCDLSPCTGKYHVVDEEKKYSDCFFDFASAEKKYCEISGDLSFQQKMKKTIL